MNKYSERLHRATGHRTAGFVGVGIQHGLHREPRRMRVHRTRFTADVVDALRFAREQGLEVAVRGGEHNVAGHAVCGGELKPDLSLLQVSAPASGGVTLS